MAEVARVSTAGHRKAGAAKQRGVAQLIERVVWDHEAASLSLATPTRV